MAGLDLQAIRSALRDVARDGERAERFVTAHRLGVAVADQPEPRIFRALSGSPQARIAVRGPAGSGKTSTMAWMLGRLPSLGHATIALRIPLAPQKLTFGELLTAVADLLADTLARAANKDAPALASHGIDLDLLMAATAKSSTFTPASQDTAVRVGAGVGVLSAGLIRTFKKETKSLTIDVSADQRQRKLQRVLEEIADAGIRVLVVIDDTEHFAQGAAVEESDVADLYKAIGQLSGLPLQIALGLHPRFHAVGAATHVLSRHGFEIIDVARLPTSAGSLKPVLQQRLDVAGIDLKAAEVFSTEAIAQLEALYHADANRHDYRYVLKVAAAACEHARANGEPTVKSGSINAALEASEPTT